MSEGERDPNLHMLAQFVVFGTVWEILALKKHSAFLSISF